MTEPRTVREILTNICIVVTMSLVIGVSLEVGARLLRGSRAVTTLEPEAAPDPEDTLERYVQYVEFREGEYASPLLNIDSQSRRRVPGSCERDDAFTVMTFGGSTMFGAGVSDQHTIPAYLAAGFNRNGRCVKVVNYGAGWWQSSQSLIQLIEVLKRGARPQVVVFYDGVNDVNVVAFGGVPGGIAPDVAEAFTQAFRRLEFGEPLSAPGGRWAAWAHIARQSLVVRTLADRLRPSRHKDLNNDFEVPQSDVLKHVAALVDIYAANVRVVNALSKEYGFTAQFFLQPLLMVPGKPRTAAEAAAVKARTDVRTLDVTLFNLAYDAFKAHPYFRSLPNYHDLSGVFDGMTAELYGDSEHLNPEGNRIVAERIARELVLP